jgi:purine-nucleoside phosphorylase
MLEQIEFTTKSIREKTNNFLPQVGIILGTGLGGLVKEISVQFAIPYNEIPNFPVSTVEGHSGKLIFGELGGKNVVAEYGPTTLVRDGTDLDIQLSAKQSAALANYKKVVSK